MPCLTSLDEVIKSPAEVLNVSMSFVDVIGSAIINSQTTVVTPTGITVSNESILSGIVYFTLAGGTEGQTYNVEVTIITNDGQTIEGNGKLKVREG